MSIRVASATSTPIAVDKQIVMRLSVLELNIAARDDGDVDAAGAVTVGTGCNGGGGANPGAIQTGTGDRNRYRTVPAIGAGRRRRSWW